jgi:hypothetical protein
MADREIPADVLSVSYYAGPGADAEAIPQPSLLARLTARLRAAKLDRQLAVGVIAPTGSALAAHESRVVSAAERASLARTLRHVLRDARVGGLVLSSRLPVSIPNVLAAEEVIDAITLRLHSPRPVSARGMARLRQILGDGTGPLYRYGRGDLRGRLGAALAAL